MSLYSIAAETWSRHPATKAPSVYKIYDSFLARHAITPNNILEVGVYDGESTKIFASCYKGANIVAVDLTRHDIDFSAYPNVTYLNGDQSNKGFLQETIARYFPGGIDLVIEDASHIGSLSLATFRYVFPYVKSGAAYFVEDWGTGYWNDWPDGENYSKSPEIHGKSIKSHNAGMVGFVKSLVDLCAGADIKKFGTIDQEIQTLEFHLGLCLAVKK